MKRCIICNGNNVYEIDILTSSISGIDIEPINENLPILVIADLPEILQTTYCGDCKQRTKVTGIQ